MIDILLHTISLHWFDLLLCVLLALYAWEGYAQGFLASIGELGRFLVTLTLSLALYTPLAQLSSSVVFLSYATICATLLLGCIVIIDWGLFILTSPFLNKIHAWVYMQRLKIQQINAMLGIFPRFIHGALLCMVLFAILTSFPISSLVREAITNSFIGRILLSHATTYDIAIHHTLGEPTTALINFITLESDSNKSLRIFTKESGISIPAEENVIARRINYQRKLRHLAPLHQDTHALHRVAYLHAQDMLKRGYFSHITMEGLSVFDRLGKANIPFTYANENIVRASYADIALQGLFLSPSYRENIFSSQITSMGISVVKDKEYGEMIVIDFVGK